MKKSDWLKLQADKGARKPSSFTNQDSVAPASPSRETRGRQFGGNIPRKMWRKSLHLSMPSAQYGILEMLAEKSGTTPNKVARSFVQAELAKMNA